MPILENERWELFAQKLAAGENATSAYESVGFKRSRSNAARLSANENVRRRVGELQAAGAKSAEVSVTSLLAELEEARAKATDLKQLSAAVRAISEKAKISGLMIERQQIEITGPDDDEPKSMDELCRRMADERLDGLTNARWLPISDQDRRHLADINARWFAEMQAFVDEVNARPLIHTRKVEPHNGVAQRVITKGKDEV